MNTSSYIIIYSTQTKFNFFFCTVYMSIQPVFNEAILLATLLLEIVLTNNAHNPILCLFRIFFITISGFANIANVPATRVCIKMKILICFIFDIKN